MSAASPDVDSGNGGSSGGDGERRMSRYLGAIATGPWLSPSTG